MILNLIVFVHLLAIERGLTAESTAEFRPPLKFIDINAPATVENATSTIEYVIFKPNKLHLETGDVLQVPTGEPNSQVQHTKDDMGHHPVVRYTSDNLEVNENLSPNRNASNEKAATKSKGFIEFEFDINDDLLGRESHDGGGTNSPYSTAFDRIMSRLIPQGISDIFRFSYVAGPTNTNPQINEITNSTRRNIEKQSQSLLSPNPFILSPLPSTSTSTTTSVEESRSLVSLDQIHDINASADSLGLKYEDQHTFDETFQQDRFYPESHFGERINKAASNASMYEGQIRNPDDDNFIAPSQVVANQVSYPPAKEVQINAGRNGKYPDIPSPGLEKQINLQIIPNRFQDYGKKTVFSPTKQLDEFQEQVEKQFNPSDVQSQTEAASRTFLKKFKGGYNGHRPVESANQVPVQPKPIEPATRVESANQFAIQTKNPNQYEVYPKVILPESQLHTYIYSSQPTKDDEKDYSQQKSYHVSTPPVSDYTNDSQSQPVKHESSLHTYIFSAIFDQDSEHQPNNKTHKAEIADNTKKSYEEDDAQISENQESRQTSEYQPSDYNNLYVTRGYSNEVDGYTYPSSPYPSIRNRPRTLVEVQKSLNIHNKYITEKNGNLIEQHETYTRPQHYFESSHGLKLLEITTPISLSENPIRVAQADDAHQSESAVEPEVVLQESHSQQQEQLQNQQQEQLQQQQQDQTQYQEQLQQQQEQLHQQQLQQRQEQQQYQEQLQQQQQDQLRQQQQHQGELQQQQQQQQQHQQQQQQQQQQLQHQQQQQHQQLQQQQQQHQQQHHSEEQQQQQYANHVVEKHVPYPVQVLQPYPVERLVEKYVDRPVPVDRVVEKQVNIPYPVREVVEKIVDRPVPVEKVIERPVHIPYPVQVNHFIDRPYAVQYPVAIAVPIPVAVHRFIDRPYAVEKIVDRPIHIPYPVEKIVEKIVEKHVPIEVERIVEKPAKKVEEKPSSNKKIVPIHVPVAVGVPIPIIVTKNKNSKKKPIKHIPPATGEDFSELVPPPLPTADGGRGYKTLPENIDILLLDDFNGQAPIENEYMNWNQPVKRSNKNHNAKRSPDFGRNFRVEYGFKPPIVPSLEINNLGLPLKS